MKGIFASSFTRPLIESNAFPAPKEKSYDRSHPRLVLLKYGDSEKLACMKYKTTDTIAMQDRKVVLYAHGNATDIGQIDPFVANELFVKLKTDFLTFDYPGYGLSSGKPTEYSCNVAILIAYEYLRLVGFQEQNIFLYGVSIGTGPTAFLASQNSKVGGCLLQTPFTTVVSVVFPAIAMCFQQTECSVCSNPDIYRTKDIISSISCPLILLHGTNDEVIPYEHSVELQKAAHSNCKLVTLEGATHNSIGYTSHQQELLTTLQHLIKN